MHQILIYFLITKHKQIYYRNKNVCNSNYVILKPQKSCYQNKISFLIF